MENIKTGGVYRHYKGNLYTVIGIARHSETLEEMVIYRCHKDNMSLWARPAHMWNEEVTVNGETVRRFALVEESEEN